MSGTNKNIIIISSIVFLIIFCSAFVIGYAYLINKDSGSSGNRTVFVNNMHEYSVEVEIERNDKLFDSVIIKPDEDVMYFKEFDEGDVVTVTNVLDPSRYRSIVLEDKDMAFFIYSDSITVRELD